MIYQAVNILSTKIVRFKTSMLRSGLCGYSDAYIVVKGTIDLLAAAENEMIKLRKMFRLEIMLHLDNFRSYISKIDSTLIDNAEDLDKVIPTSDLLEYSQNYSMTSGSLLNYYNDEIDDVDGNCSVGKSFKYKTKIV